MFYSTIRSQVKKLLQQFDHYVDVHIDTALKITAGLKQILSTPVADIVTAIIPGNADDVIRQQLISALAKAIEVLTIAENCKAHENTNEKLVCFVQQLQQKDPQLQEALLQKLASLVAGQLDGQRLRQNLYDLYTQAKYSSLKP
jgi:hypothetical protein